MGPRRRRWLENLFPYGLENSYQMNRIRNICVGPILERLAGTHAPGPGSNDQSCLIVCSQLVHC